MGKKPSESILLKRCLKRICLTFGLGLFLLMQNTIPLLADSDVIIGKSDELQQIRITGHVVDASNNPMAGVNVVESGTTNGILTGADGSYSISVASSKSVISFSFIGYATVDVTVENQTTINVTLKENVLGLQEVVVTGYGSQKKATLTGSIVNVGGDELTKSPMANVTNSLSGKLPGLIVNQRNGEPGRDDPSIHIRGTGTFDSNTSDNIDPTTPLVIIDGVERDYMSKLNPDDIESVSVLKDASAAIYGARAANGVIIVTTKSGKLGKPVFSFSYNTAFQHPTKVPEMLDAVTYAQVYNEGDYYRQGRPANYSHFILPKLFKNLVMVRILFYIRTQIG